MKPHFLRLSKNVLKKSKYLFDKDKSTDETSVLNSDKLYHIEIELSSKMTQHSSFPWEVFSDDLHHLEETNMKDGKALLMFPNGIRMSAFDKTFGEDFNYHMDDVPGLLDTVKNAFTIRREFREHSKSVLMDIAYNYRRNHPKKFKFKNKKNITFVGIHQRRGDHVSFRKEHNIDELGTSYFLESMEMFREKFKNVVFVYVSDDLEWGKEKLQKRIKTQDFFIAGSLQEQNLKGEK